MLNIKQYSLISKIGEGSFGSTYKAIDNSRHQKVAIKIINVNKVPNIQYLLDEVNVLKAISSLDNCDPAISCYYESFLEKWKGSNNMFIVMEYIEGVTLRSYIDQLSVSNRQIDEKLLWSIFYGLAKALFYIHNQGIAHRDIKPENIMITPDANIKFIDFGLSCVSKCFEIGCLNICNGNIVGSIPYIAPEFVENNLWVGDEVSRLEAAKRGDMWGLGLVMFELANIKDKFPFPISYDQYQQLYLMMISSPNKSQYKKDPNINLIVDSLIQKDPMSRITSQELLIHVSNMIISASLFR